MMADEEWSTFSVGDIVSRDGTDEHEIEEIIDDGSLLTVRCIKAPQSNWTWVGDTHSNTSWRYTLVRKALENHQAYE